MVAAGRRWGDKRRAVAYIRDARRPIAGTTMKKANDGSVQDCVGVGDRGGGMTVHLVKMAVGVESIPHLAEIQARRLRQAAEAGSEAILRHVTRNTPRRAAELTDGGSIYWVIRGFIQVRQAIVDCAEHVNDQGGPACALVLDPRLVRTELRPSRPFQGWRYLAAEKAPPDLPANGAAANDLPIEMADELRALGLL